MKFNIPGRAKFVQTFGVKVGGDLRDSFESQRMTGGRDYISLLSASHILGGEIERVTVGLGRVVIRYVNVGDSYRDTVLIVNGKLRIGSIGDLLENVGGDQ